MRSGLISTALIFLISLSGFSQVEVSSSFERDSIQIGEQLKFQLQIESSGSLRSVVPDIESSIGKGLEIVSDYEDSVAGDQYIYRFEYLMTCFDSGVYNISPVEILVNDGNILDTLYTSSHDLNVYTPVVDTSAEIKDIKAAMKTPLTFKEFWSMTRYFLAGFLLLAIAVMIYWFVKRKEENEIRKEVIPAHIKAIRDLDRIKTEKLWQQGKVKEYYSQLSGTVRMYIEDRFNIPAMESVTSDILKKFRRFSYDDDSLMEILENMLNLSDLVKFAKEDPSPSENETNLNQAYILIEKTKPIEELRKEEDQNKE